MKKFIHQFVILATLIVGVILFGFSQRSTSAAPNTKVTICHVVGLEGGTQYTTLTISEEAVYGHNGNAGHFNEDGTTKAGHEQDYFGPCHEGGTPSVTNTPIATATVTPTLLPTSTSTPTSTPMPQETFTATVTPTNTPMSIDTETPTPAATNTAIATATASATAMVTPNVTPMTTAPSPFPSPTVPTEALVPPVSVTPAKVLPAVFLPDTGDGSSQGNAVDITVGLTPAELAGIVSIVSSFILLGALVLLWAFSLKKS